jgi:hypothetical protein
MNRRTILIIAAIVLAALTIVLFIQRSGTDAPSRATVRLMSAEPAPGATLTAADIRGGTRLMVRLQTQIAPPDDWQDQGYSAALVARLVPAPGGTPRTLSRQPIPATPNFTMFVITPDTADAQGGQLTYDFVIEFTRAERPEVREAPQKVRVTYTVRP